MKRFAALVMLALVAAACGGGGTTTVDPGTSSTTGAAADYPQAVVDEYMGGCTPEAGEEFCQCTIDEFEKRLSLSEFLAAAERGIENEPVAQDVIDVCLREVDGPGTTQAGGFTPITDIDQIIEATVADLEIYWSETMPDVWGIGYESPAFIGPYFVSEGDEPECGGPLQPDNYVGNAFYCGFDDTIQWDQEGLMAPLFQEFGDFTVAMVLAHEWGHAIQARYGFDSVTHPTIVSELQADCFAGAWSGRVAADESDILRLEPGDLEEAMAGFLLIGDALGTAPGGPDAHGGSFDRLTAFFEGFNSGVDRCATYEDDPPNVVFIPLLVGDDPNQGGDLPYDQTAPLLIDSLEIFWELVYPEFFAGEWVPVSEVIPYRPSSGNLPECGGFGAEEAFYRGNAFYCAADDYVAWDDEVLFPGLYQDIGDFAIGLVLANEWGRAVQSRAGLPLEGTAAQLQVDCFSGVFTAALTFEDNPTGVLLSAGDLEEGIAGFLTLSAAPDIAGGASAFARFDAFKNGFFDGMSACGVG